MCPVCMATAAAWIATSATSIGGLAVAIAKKFRGRKSANKVPAESKLKEKDDGQ
jgi:hypothetical protein